MGEAVGEEVGSGGGQLLGVAVAPGDAGGDKAHLGGELHIRITVADVENLIRLQAQGFTGQTSGIQGRL